LEVNFQQVLAQPCELCFYSYRPKTGTENTLDLTFQGNLAPNQRGLHRPNVDVLLRPIIHKGFRRPPSSYLLLGEPVAEPDRVTNRFGQYDKPAGR